MICHRAQLSDDKDITTHIDFTAILLVSGAIVKIRYKS